MRYEPEHKTRTRDRIVRNAARKLRAEGLSGPGLASVMKASGLLSAMAGAVSIARMLIDPADRQKALASMRDHLLHSF